MENVTIRNLEELFSKLDVLLEKFSECYLIESFNFNDRGFVIIKQLVFNEMFGEYWKIGKFELLRNLIENLRKHIKTLSVKFKDNCIEIKALIHENILTNQNSTDYAGSVLLKLIEKFHEDYGCYITIKESDDFLITEIFPLYDLINVYLKNPKKEDLKKIMQFSKKYKIPIKRSANELSILESNKHLENVLTWENFILDDILFEYPTGSQPAIYSEREISKRFVIYKDKVPLVFSGKNSHEFSYKVRYSFDSWIEEVEKIYLEFYNTELKAIQSRWLTDRTPIERFTDEDAFDDEEQYRDFLASR